MKKNRALSVLFKILFCFAVIFIVVSIGNFICNLELRGYIKSFEPVNYSDDRIVPTYENGHYVFKTDEDFKIMHLTDIHIGGGMWTYKNDRKTIYELITMLQAEKPDLVILGGDNTYCILGIGFNGGFTINNKMVAKTLITALDHEGVYFSTVFGNHDTESIDMYSRKKIGELYESGISEYCIFKSEFTDKDADTVPSVSNQFILIKNSANKIVKPILLIDSNAYLDTSFISTVFGRYDVIHDEEISWAKETIEKLSIEAGLPEGQYLKTISFMHIPISEFQVARDEYKDSSSINLISGGWDEAICYGGRNNNVPLKNKDNFYEVLCEEMNSVEAIFCGHDHVNNAVVDYEGVMLSYGYSLDNEAYKDGIMNSGLQRGATVITVHPDGTFNEQHKNAYLDYGCSTDKFVPIYLDEYYYPDQYEGYKR